MSRDTFYRYKAAVEEGGVEALFERTRRKPNLANRVGEATEQAVIKSALEFPAYGQARTSNELRKQGVFVSPLGVRSIWLRHDLANFKARLKALEARVAEDGIILTEAHIRGPGAGLGKEESRRRSPRRGGNGPPRLSGFTGHLLCRHPEGGVGRIYQQSYVDPYSKVAQAKLYTTKTPITAADLLNDRVLPFHDEHDLPVLRIMTDRGTEYCGRADKHDYQLFLAINDIDHTKTKVKSPQTNGIRERFHKTVLQEFYQVAFRKRLYDSVDALQDDLDQWLHHYNTERTHQGKMCCGRTPFQTMIEGKEIWKEKFVN